MMMKFIFTILFCFSIAPLIANQTAKEINYLYKCIEDTEMVFIRNGKEHPKEEAIAHLNKKQKHFSKEIKTTEDFIAKCASKSLVSGKKYQIKLKEKEQAIDLDQWLTEKLTQFRNTQKENDEK